jgi:hypothetical protein
VAVRVLGVRLYSRLDDGFRLMMSGDPREAGAIEKACVLEPLQLGSLLVAVTS